MAFSGTTYNNVAGATTAAAGNVVASATWDNIHTDLGNALTQLMQQLVSNVSLRNVMAANGGFEVWQRDAGSSANIAVAASTTAYTADRWYLATGTNQSHHVAAKAGLTNGSQLCAQVQRDSGQTGTGGVSFSFPLDTDELYRLRGNKVSARFVAATGANWSPASGSFLLTLYVGTGAVGKRGGGFTNETNVLQITTNLAAGSGATVVTGTSTVAVPTNATQGEVQVFWTPVGTAGANDWIQLDDMQLEANLSAGTWTQNNFDRLPFDTQLAMCKRHFQKTTPYSVAPAQNAGLVGAISCLTAAATKFGTWWEFPVEIRATGAFTTFNPSGSSANWQDVTAAASLPVTVDTANGAGFKSVMVYGGTAASANDLIYIHAQVDAGI